MRAGHGRFGCPMAVPSIAQGGDGVRDRDGGMTGWGVICPQDGQDGGAVNTGLSPAPGVTRGPWRSAGPRSPMASPTSFDDVHELGHLVVNGTALFHLIADLFDRMNDGGVIPAAEFTGDGGIAEIGALAHDVHGD